jgi:inorganic phosphate transporter, PiT family
VWANVLILVLGVGFGYVNGLQGSASIVSTLISSRAMTPRKALFLASMGVIAGPFLFGVAVAATIGTQLIDPRAITPIAVIAALLTTLTWNWFALRAGIPTSTSHTLVGSLIGVVIISYGFGGILPNGLSKTLVGLFISPTIGVIGAFCVTRLLWRASSSASPKINRWFQRGQIVLSVMLAAMLGSNDGQKIIGVLMLGLIATGMIQNFEVPLWVVGLSAMSIGLGTLMGGWPLIHALANKFYRIRPIEGFGAQMTTVLMLMSAGYFGAPVSSSQVVTSAIIGAGSADRIQKIRWQAIMRILVGWAVTIPTTACLSALLYELLRALP